MECRADGEVVVLKTSGTGLFVGLDSGDPLGSQVFSQHTETIDALVNRNAKVIARIPTKHNRLLLKVSTPKFFSANRVVLDLEDSIGIERIVVYHNDVLIGTNAIKGPQKLHFRSRVDGHTIHKNFCIQSLENLQLSFILEVLIAKFERHVDVKSFDVVPRHVFKNGANLLQPFGARRHRNDKGMLNF